MKSVEFKDAWIYGIFFGFLAIILEILAFNNYPGIVAGICGTLAIPSATFSIVSFMVFFHK